MAKTLQDWIDRAEVIDVDDMVNGEDVWHEKLWSEEEVDKLEKKYKDLLKNMCP